MSYRPFQERYQEVVDTIFQRVFYCSVPYLASLSDEEIELNGLPYLNDREFDNYVYHHDVNCALTINRMVEMFKRGVDIKIRHYSDTLIIYDTIVEYLELWQTRLQTGLNNGKAPFDDLMALDQLAAKIHPFAINESRHRDVSTGLKRAMQDSGMFSISTVLKQRQKHNELRNVYGPGKQHIQDQQDEEYVSLIDDFRQRRAQNFQPAFHIPEKE